MSEICYPKNYLQEVVARIDFSSTIKGLNEAVLPKNVQQALKARYPVFESLKGQLQNYLIDNKGVQTINHEFQQWTFHGENREKTITVNQDFITVSIKEYKSYEEFKLDVIVPIEEISKIENNIFINRTGLRYVNVIPNISNTYEEIEKKFHPMLISNFQSFVDEGNLSRSVSINEYIHDEVKCRVQSGIFNPDYPAKIKNREFVLDIDAFIDTPHPFTNINELFDTLHSEIQSKFEQCITENLRSELNAK